MAFDMNAGRHKREQADSTETQIELREQLKQRNQSIDAVNVASDDPVYKEEGTAESPTGISAEKPCFVTIAIPESIKRIVDMKVKYESKELPIYNQTLKHVGRRWFLRGLLAEGLITKEQFDEASSLDSEYGWERDRVAAKRRRN